MKERIHLVLCWVNCTQIHIPKARILATICHKKADSNIKCFQNSQLGVLWLKRENTPKNLLGQSHSDPISQGRAFLVTIGHKKAGSYDTLIPMGMEYSLNH